MDQSSAELPVDRLIEACEAAFDFHHDQAAREWDARPEKHAEWLLAYDSREVFLLARRSERGPEKLYWLLIAAKASGETKIRVTAEDFYPIFSPYLDQKNK